MHYQKNLFTALKSSSNEEVLLLLWKLQNIKFSAEITSYVLIQSSHQLILHYIMNKRLKFTDLFAMIYAQTSPVHFVPVLPSWNSGSANWRHRIAVIIGGLFPMGRINPLTASSYASCVFMSMLECLEKEKREQTFLVLLFNGIQNIFTPNKAELQFLLLKLPVC